MNTGPAEVLRTPAPGNSHPLATRETRLLTLSIRACLAVLSLLLPALLSAQSAQDVPVTTNGPVSVIPVPTIYNGRYVISRSDFGFFWLDTESLVPGHVQAVSKCGPWPPSDSNLYVIGDCNGISSVSSSGNLVVARNLTGNCLAMKRGCNGPRDDGHVYVMFALGTWTYLAGQEFDIPDSTQATDLQGRTWTIYPDPLYTDGQHFIYHTDGNPTAPPTARATATNQSAAGRADTANYFGDAWTLHDTSLSVAPITQIQWNFKYNGTFVADRTAARGDTVNPAYFPCDSAGNISTGVGCFPSLTAGSYSFALKATNQYGTTQYTSPATPIAVPQIQIAGFSGGVLNVLTGGNADASATQGNPVSFSWIFNPGSIARSGAVVSVPPGATSFSLVVSYAGFSTNVSGPVSQVDLVPGFSLSPNPVVVAPALLTLTNQMQRGPAATLNSVDYAYDGGGFVPLATCPASFCNVGGTATVTAPPAPAGSHTVQVRYNFTGTGGAQSLTASRPFSTIVFTANPIPIITLDPAGGQLACAGFGCNLLPVTTYYLWDMETLPPGITHPGTQWTYNSVPIGSTPGQGPLAWTTPAAQCSSGCTLVVTVAGVSTSLQITVTGPTTAMSFYTLTPCRLVDTRNPAGPLGGPALSAGAQRTFVVASQCGIPATARALTVNVTVTQASAGGDLRLFPGGVAAPLVSTINYRAGQTRANAAVEPLGAAGDLTVLCDQSAGSVHLILDVNGYFQ